MAKQAKASPHTEIDPSAHLRVVVPDSDRPFVAGAARNRVSLADLSVGETEARQLESSNHQARILIELPDDKPTTYLRYLENHLQGRGAFLTIEEGTVLDVLYHVHENSHETANEVNQFAHGILQLLGLPESALMLATVKTMDDERLRRILIAAGIQPPDLRLLT